jgi:hypothetical protein
MNPDTGEIRQFASDKEAVAAGHTIRLTEQQAASLRQLPQSIRPEVARKMGLTPEKSSFNAPHPSGLNRKQRRSAEKAAKREALKKGGSR